MQNYQWIIAAITAAFVAVIAFLQWRVAQRRSILDLFERRHAIYETVRNAVGVMMSSSLAFDVSREIEFMEAMERAYFFFGDDVVAYIRELWEGICDVRDADKELPDITDPTERTAMLAKRRNALNRIMQFHTVGKPLFARYMRFAERVPTGWRPPLK